MKKNRSFVGNILNEVSSYYTNKKNYLINEAINPDMYAAEEEDPMETIQTLNDELESMDNISESEMFQIVNSLAEVMADNEISIEELKNYPAICQKLDMGQLEEYLEEFSGDEDDYMDDFDFSEDDLFESSKGNPVFKQSNGTENNFNLQESIARNVRKVIRRNLR